MKTETSNAQLTISRVVSNFEPTQIAICIRYGKELHRVMLTPEAFALAVTGLGYQPAIYEQTEVGRVSK